MSDWRESDPLLVEAVQVGVSVALRSVAMKCDKQAHCHAQIMGDGDTVIEGDGEGWCDDGRSLSGSHGSCLWTWKTRRAEPWEPKGPTAELPVHIARFVRLRAREHVSWLQLALAPRLYTSIGTTRVAIESPHSLVAVTSVPGGSVGVSDHGELYALR